MAERVDLDTVVAELRELRREFDELRRNQAEVGRAVEELARTFRAIAVHLGVASEPYRVGSRESGRDPSPGFA